MCGVGCSDIDKLTSVYLCVCVGGGGGYLSVKSRSAKDVEVISREIKCTGHV